MKTALLTLLPLLMLAAECPAAPQGPKTLTLKTTDGRTTRAQVLELVGEKAKLKVLVVGGEMTVTRSLSDFEPESAFRIEEEAVHADSFDEHFALAKKAADMRLLGPAGAHGRTAVEMAEGTPRGEAKVAEVRGWAAGALEEMTKEAVAEKDLRSAKHYLKVLSTRLADQCSEEQLDSLAAMVEGLDHFVAEEKQTERQAKLDEKERAEIERRFKPIDAAVEKGDKLQREAIAKSRNTSQSSRLAEQSIGAYKAAWKATEAVQKKYPNNPDVAREVAVLASRLHDSAIRSALHAANVLTVQSDYRGAMDWANKVLAFDPNNQEAKQMVRTIQIAGASASRRWGWGW